MTPAVAELSAKLATLLAHSVCDVELRAVAHTGELDRVLALPRRTWREDDPTVVRLTLEMSAWLRRPGSSATLRPIQAFALAELYHVHGLFGPMRVGSGKTLITYLASTLLGAKRPVLCIPAKLREKTKREFARLAKDWRGPESLQIFSYTELSRDYGDLVVTTAEGYPLVGPPSKTLVEACARHPEIPFPAYYGADGAWWPVAQSDTRVLVKEHGLLDKADPDLIIDDEVHHMKNPKAACTRKMDRFMDTHPTMPHVDLSGTITKDKIQDYAHVLRWSLKGYAPVPRNFYSVREWGNALNVKVQEEDRLDVGALIELASPEDRKTCDAVTAARRGFRRRLIETPGVVAYAKQYDGASLLIEETAEPNYAPSTEVDFALLRTGNKRADGSTLPDGLAVWAHARQRALGFYYTLDPAPPLPWKNARTEWHAAVRQAIKYGSQLGIDSEFQVARIASGARDPRAEKFAGEVWNEARRAYAAWNEIKPTFLPNKTAVWCDDAAIRLAADWMANHRGLVWVEHIEFAERLSQVTGAPFFHEKGLDAAGRFVEDARPSDDGSIIVSIDSNAEGRNLQHHWSENFFTSLPKGGNKFEQTLGRTHREDQRADEVSAEVMVTCREQGEGWLKILEESRYMADTTMQVEEGQPLPAKVFYADVVMLDALEIETRALRTARFG